jgi:hypothetical protein
MMGVPLNFAPFLAPLETAMHTDETMEDYTDPHLHTLTHQHTHTHTNTHKKTNTLTDKTYTHYKMQHAKHTFILHNI